MNAFAVGARSISNFVEFAFERFSKKEKRLFDFSRMESKEQMRPLFFEFAQWLTTERKLFRVNKIKQRNYEVHATLGDVAKELGSTTLATSSIKFLLKGLCFAVCWWF